VADCIFCKIANGSIPSAKVWENGEFVAILDINPNVKGMTLILSKEHYESYVFDIPQDVQLRMFEAAEKVAKKLEKALNVQRVALVMEGMGIDHAHLKLYPLHGVEEKFKEMWAKEKVFFERYDGYISTQLGPQADPAELAKLAEQIRQAGS